MSLFSDKKRSQLGGIISGEFLLFIPIIMILVFGVIDFWIVMTQYNQAEHTKNFYLEKIRLEGCLTNEDRISLIQDLEKLGITVTEIIAPNEYNRVVRQVKYSGPEDVPQVYLEIIGEYSSNTFLLGVFFGNENKNIPFYLQGKTHTEYISS